MRFFVISICTYIVLSVVVVLVAIWTAGPNPDGFGPGLAVVMMMIYVLPVVSIAVGGVACFIRKLKAESDAEECGDAIGSHDEPRFNECG